MIKLCNSMQAVTSPQLICCIVGKRQKRSMQTVTMQANRHTHLGAVVVGIQQHIRRLQVAVQHLSTACSFHGMVHHI